VSNPIRQGAGLVLAAGPEGADVHLDQANNIRVQRLDKVYDFRKVAIGSFEEAHKRQRQVKLPADTGAIAYVVKQKAHMIFSRLMAELNPG